MGTNENDIISNNNYDFFKINCCYKLVSKIDIIDNGPGIDADMLEKVFYPMVTGRPEGTGLGLSITQALINQHGGLVECKSRPGETIFTIYLPLENSDEQ